ncbi:sensor histidine kinase [Paenibacillus chitinolyticus]|uniref:sensor histidine kinase n=1 Tax=Paenibacillus chitinolyticus TaxID=79263 RepID=UPI00366FCA81
MYPKWLLSIMTVIIIVIQAWFIHLIFTYPLVGIYIKEAQQNRWLITDFETRQVPQDLGLQLGDQILKIDGGPPQLDEGVIKWGAIGRGYQLEILRGDEIVDIKPTTHVTYYDLGNIFGQILCFTILIILIRKMPPLLSFRYLCLIFLDLGILFMSLPGSMRFDGLAKYLVSTTVMLLPVLFFHFFMMFISERNKERQPVTSKLLKFVYVFIGICFLVQLIYLVPSSLTKSIYHIMGRLSMIVFVVGFIFNIASLLLFYKKEREDKKYAMSIIKMIFISLIISFGPITFLYFIPLVFSLPYIVDPVYGGLFALLFPILLTYLIATKQLYEIDLFVRRLLFMAVMSIIPSVFFTGVLVAYLPDLPFQQIILVFMLGCMFCSAFLFSLEYFTKITEPYFFPRRSLHRDSLRRITDQLSEITTFREFKEAVLKDIVSVLQVYGAAIVFASSKEVDVVCDGDIDERIVKNLTKDKPFQECRRGEYFIYPISKHGEYTSHLILTEEKENTYVSTEDRQWLRTVIGHLSVSLENVYLIRTMQMKMQQIASQIPNEEATDALIWFRKVLFDLQEKERIRIATDLHDTTMQDLFFLKRRLSNLQEDLTPQHRSQIVNMMEYIDIINANLRQSCYELHPHLIKETGIVLALQKLIDQEMKLESFEVDFRVEEADTVERLSLETKRHLFRVIQELLNNAKKHSEANLLSIRLGVSNEQVLLFYEDDGKGFNIDLLDWQDGRISGMGMKQLKSRIISLNGQFSLESSEGNGLKIQATIPWKEGAAF